MRISILCAGAEVRIRSGKYAGRRGGILRGYFMADWTAAGQYYTVRLRGVSGSRDYRAEDLEAI